MCFYKQQKESVKKVQKRFNANVNKPELFLQSDEINGFSHPQTPIVVDINPSIITMDYSWGLIPSWANDPSFRRNTLNARIETVEEKPSFRGITHQRCLIIATGFYEWRWNDEKGKSKQKYLIVTNEDLFAMAGLYSTWKNKVTGEIIPTYTILTTEANSMMKYIHNTKQRMPVILKPEDEQVYLKGTTSLSNFAYPYERHLMSFEV